MKKRNCGFTLIEILIVIALMAVLTGVGADLFVNSLKAYQKSQIMNQLSQNGNYTMSTILNIARNAKEVIITDNGKTLEIKEQSSTSTYFKIKASPQDQRVGIITKKVGEGTEETITNSNPSSGIDIDTGASSFEVTGGDGTPQTLTVTLRISQAPDTPINRAYETSITLTNSVIIRGEYFQ